ncbi:murein biosynthesis integral membrane protein MurJ [Streptomyces sp. AS02]|uniref:murein biosynthesis integral membrane protein MurJ n=1 Tax=Streptomyces sp. AS02 TaxID=2938946 RepID=UPI002021C61D|nr:lipid II flippase MurJ [Streptomyces sp. AS02]MCL8017871.1 murein biosynthesis protein MurJ [Streptomyces sp. AS02]
MDGRPVVESSRRFLARATLLSAALSMAGALLGLGRDQTLAHLFGAGADTDAFLVAWTVPEMASTLLIEDGMAFVLVPAFSVALARRVRGIGGPDPVHALVAATLPRLCLALAGTAAVLAAGAPLLVSVLAPGLPDPALAVSCTRLTATCVLSFGLAGYCGAALRAHGSYLAPGAIYIAYNAAIITTMCALTEHWGVRSAALGVALGGFLMATLLAPPLWRRITGRHGRSVGAGVYEGGGGRLPAPPAGMLAAGQPGLSVDAAMQDGSGGRQPGPGAELPDAGQPRPPANAALHDGSGGRRPRPEAELPDAGQTRPPANAAMHDGSGGRRPRPEAELPDAGQPRPPANAAMHDGSGGRRPRPGAQLRTTAQPHPPATATTHHERNGQPPAPAAQLPPPERRLAFGLVCAVLLFALCRQSQVLIERYFASGLPAGAISHLNYAQKIAQLPMSLALMVCVVTFPVVARAIAEGDTRRARDRVERDLVLTACLVLLGAAVVVACAPQIVQLLFQRGAFTAQDTATTAAVMRVYAAGLLGHTLVGALVMSYFSAARTTWYPLGAMVVGAFTTVALSAWAVQPWGARGIAAANAAGITVTALLLLHGLGPRTVPVRVRRVVAALVRPVCAAGCATGAGLAGAGLFASPALSVAAGCACVAAVFLLLALVLDAAGARSLLAPVTHSVHRSVHRPVHRSVTRKLRHGR